MNSKMHRTDSLHSNGDDVTTVNGSGVVDHRSSDGPSEDLPFSHGFLDKDPESVRTRPLYFQIVGGTLLLVLTYVIWGVLPIYWGSIFTLYNHAHNLHGWIVVSISPVLNLYSQSDVRGCLQDLDGGAIGQTVTQTFIGGSGPDTKMTWMMAPSDLNLTTREQFEHALVHEKAWAIVASA